MRKLAILALCAVLLAGCGSVPAASAPAAESTAQSDITATVESAAAQAQDHAQDTKAAQIAVLDQFVAFGADTAGGSLKTTMAAASLVEYLSAGEIEADTMNEWLAGLTDDESELLALNWPGILSAAEAISSDPSGQADALASAGVETDFAAMTLTDVPDKLVNVNTVLSGKAG